MATFTEIYYNGNEYREMWLNGSKVWAKASGGGEIVYPYPDCDSVITYMNTSSNRDVTFDIIDSSLPYSINGVETNKYTFPSNTETKVKLINLKPTTSTSSTLFPTNIEQLRIPNLTYLSYLFRYFCYDSNYEYSWSPQYFEFNENPTSMSSMFSQCKYLTDDMMAQFMPYFPNTSKVTSMSDMFNNCQSLTKLDLTSLNINFSIFSSSGFDSVFSGCESLKDLHLEKFDTSSISNNSTIRIITQRTFAHLTSNIYVNKNKWTLDKHFCSYGATNANFILVDDDGSKEEVFKPQYHTEFSTTPNLPSWLSVCSTSDKYKFSYSSSGYYSSTNTSYNSSCVNVFQIDAPMAGILKVYFTSDSKDNDSWVCYHKLASESSYSKYKGFNHYNGSGSEDLTKRCFVYEVPVVENESYNVEIDFRQGSRDSSGSSYSNGGYILGFSIDYIPITSIDFTYDIEDLSNVNKGTFTINPTIVPSNYISSDLEVVYDSTYMNIDNNKVILKDGCQGQTLSITYRSKSDNSISNTLTFTVSQDLEFPLDIDFTQSTAPTLPSCMILDGQGSSYYFKHGTYTTNVYGLVPNNSGVNSSVAYTRYKFVAPKDGALTFTYRCYAETNFDYLTVHVNTSTSQPSYDSSTNQVFTTKGVSSYQTKDGTASVNVTQGTTYYIHIQYYKDSSNSNGYDKGCIRRIELL